MSGPSPIKLSEAKQAAIDAINEAIPEQDYIWRDLRFRAVRDGGVWRFWRGDKELEPVNASEAKALINEQSEEAFQ